MRRVESRNIAPGVESPPIFWHAARGANVRDVDGNVYIDLTAGFGVAAAGHSEPHVARAIAAQARRLAHGLGDVHPNEPKLRLLERLADIAPGPLSVGLLASAGAEAVEAALKTALLASGRPGIVAFEGSYHGLTYGALAVTGRAEFRQPFQAQLFHDVRFAPYPDAADGDAAAALTTVARALDEGAGTVIVEPVLGRGGLVVPPLTFLPALRALCTERGAILVFDEIYTGFGRTGRWFACEHTGVVPDLLVAGKALSGALPLSVALGTPEVMAAWPAWRGEALHTSTFLGNPIACAAALAQLEVIGRRGLVRRAERLGARVERRLLRLAERHGLPARSVRGIGLLRGFRVPASVDGAAPAAVAAEVVERCLRRGIILLTEGPAADVVAITPPLGIARAQLDHALDVLEQEISRTLGAARTRRASDPDGRPHGHSP